MEKAIESDISIIKVVNDDVDEVAIKAVPVDAVPVQVAESAVVTVVDSNVVPNVVVEVDHVQGEIR
jgi:hypothetical protein